MANHFNDLLLQTLKQINVRLDRLDGRMDRLNGRMDRLIDVKVDKTDLTRPTKSWIALAKSLTQKPIDIDVTNGKVDDLGRRIERIEAGIGTLKWIIGAEVAVIGVILAFIKAC